jgi:hypothetical protein
MNGLLGDSSLRLSRPVGATRKVCFDQGFRCAPPLAGMSRPRWGEITSRGTSGEHSAGYGAVSIPLG